jgi:hypothetical protein
MRSVLVATLACAACGRLGFGESANGFEIVDELDRGDLEGLTRSGGLTLDDSAPTGRFTSRVFALPGKSWGTLTWEPDAPYRVPLPDDGAAETGYPHGTVDMRDSIVVLHLDGTGTIALGDALADSSGRDNTFIAVDGGVPGAGAKYGDGLFGTALVKGADRAFFHDVVTGDDLQLGTRDFTWAVWVRSQQCTDDNSTYFGTETRTVISPHIWFGCCKQTGSLGGYFRGSTGNGIGSCDATPSIIDDVWHHVAVTKTAPAPGRVRYAFALDGEEAAVADGMTGDDVTWGAGTRFGFTNFEIASYPSSAAVGSFDEAAIWTRALSATELRAVYQRGALDLALAIRFCDSADCSDGGAFVGPDGTTATVFRDDGVDLEQPLGNVARPFMQYRVTFATSRAGVSPRLHRTILRGP